MLTKLSNRLLELYIEKREQVRQKAAEQWKNQRGAGAVEYALVVAVVVTMVVAAGSVMDTPLREFFKEAIEAIKTWLSSNPTP